MILRCAVTPGCLSLVPGKSSDMIGNSKPLVAACRAEACFSTALLEEPCGWKPWYWNPRRPTVLCMDELEERVWDHIIVRPQYDARGEAKNATVHEAMAMLDLSVPIDVKIFKLTAFHRSLAAWKPDRLLPVAPVSEGTEIVDTIRFWKGSSTELAEEAERKRKAEMAASRARERAAGTATGDKTKTRRARRPKTEQQVAMAKARASSAQLLALPWAPPAEEHATEESDVPSWVLEYESEADDAHNAYDWLEDDPHLDQTVTQLKADVNKREEVGENVSDGVAELESDLFGFAGESDGEVVPPIVIPAPNNDVDDAQDWMFAPSDDGASASGDEVSDGDAARSSGRSEGAAPSVRRAVPRGPRNSEVWDVSEEQPAGCICRRYTPTSGPPYWTGLLPEGITDSQGHHSRRRAFRPGLRSEIDARSQVEHWLNLNHEGGPEEEASSASASGSPSDASGSDSDSS